MTFTQALYSLLFALWALCSHHGCNVLPPTLLNWGAGRAVSHGVLLSVWPGLGDGLLGLDSSWDCSAMNVFAARTSHSELIVTVQL